MLAILWVLVCAQDDPQQHVIKKLDREQGRLNEKPDGGDQKKLEERTRKLARRLPDVQEASDDMKEAAQSKNEVARYYGQQAKDKLERVLAKLQGETFASLEAELERIRDEQQKIRDTSAELPKRVLDRPQLVQLRSLQGREERLARRMEDIERRVQGVYAFAARSAREDMQEVASRMPFQDTALTLQDEILRKLDDMVLALQQEAERGKAGGDSGQAAQVLDVVQLTLLRKMQESILRRTRTVREAPRTDWSELDKTTSRRLSEEQRVLGELLKNYIETLKE